MRKSLLGGIVKCGEMVWVESIIMPTLQYVQPTEEQKELMQSFREKMDGLYQEIQSSIENGRGKSLALTKLEESAMWLNKAITNND